MKSPDFIKSERELNGVTTPAKPQKGSCFSKQAVSFPAVLGYLDEYGRKRPLRVFSRGVWKMSALGFLGESGRCQFRLSRDGKKN